MSSQFSTNLRTELPGTGEQAGTWGNTTNTSLGSVLEQATESSSPTNANLQPYIVVYMWNRTA